MMRTFIALAITSLSCTATATDLRTTNGFYLGMGTFSTSNTDCLERDGYWSDECTYRGRTVELGYDFNHIVGLEVKSASGDDGDFDIDMRYVGLNIGHDFRTGWFRLYGKVGYGQIEETGLVWECRWYDCERSPMTRDNRDATLGLGVRFTFSGRADGLYLKYEALGMALDNDTVGVASVLGLGYHF